MFSATHFIWFAVDIAVITAALVYLKKYKPSLRQVLKICCVLAVISEMTKIGSQLQIVPSADGTAFYPYIELCHLPFHLCSLQILTIFYTCFSKNEKVRTVLLAFMYPTCTVGAAFAILLPSIGLEQGFTTALPYQYFLYHAMLIVLGIYIGTSGQVKLKAKHGIYTAGLLSLCAFCSVYLNSMFAAPIYENGELVSVEYTTNFFFTYATPIGIALTEKWHWFLYIGILILLGCTLIGALYLPFYIREKRAKE